MSNEKTTVGAAEGLAETNAAETPLMTLEQLTQAIEMITSVVHRLKCHLQLRLSLEAGQDVPEVLSLELLSNERELLWMQQIAASAVPSSASVHDTSHQSVILEISLLDDSSDFVQERVLH